MVPGGFEVASQVMRLMPHTSLIIRLVIAWVDLK
jgi:hypothetical protein